MIELEHKGFTFKAKGLTLMPRTTFGDILHLQMDFLRNN